MWRILAMVLVLAGGIYSQDIKKDTIWNTVDIPKDIIKKDSIHIYWRRVVYSYGYGVEDKVVEFRFKNDSSKKIKVTYLKGFLCSSYRDRYTMVRDYAQVILDPKQDMEEIIPWWADDYPCRKFSDSRFLKITMSVLVAPVVDPTPMPKDTMVKKLEFLKKDTVDTVLINKNKHRKR